MSDKEKIVLSISLLVSNRIDTIRNCMESLRPLLEQLPCELIAVDTVGEENSDGSLAIVKEYATKVVHFDWCNDFAAARNAGLECATGEWFMFLDDDEWFEDCSEIVEFFQSGEYRGYGCASYQIRNYTDRKGSYSKGSLLRMVCMEADTKFNEKVHEYISPIRPPQKDFQAYVHHSGYVFDTEEEHVAHSNRNLSLLRPEFEKNPTDLRLRLQMVQECMFLKHLEEEAVKLCEELFEMPAANYVHPAFQWILTAYIRIADRNEAWETVISRIKASRKRFIIGPFSNLAFYIMEIKALEKLGQMEEIMELAEGFCSAYHFLKENPDQIRKQKSLDFEVFLEPDIIAVALKTIIVAMHKQGKKEDALKLCQMRQQILNTPILSISLLVSNRKDTVINCMESLRPLLQQIPSELIVVDTVGEEHSDGSLAIAKNYATRIIHFDWCNDFSAARNAGLEKTTGEWFMFLDDDEWFEDCSELVDFFKSGEYLCYSSGTYRIRNYTNLQGTEYNETEAVRMVRKGKNTKFIGSIHEAVSDVYLPCKTSTCFVHHFGYAYKSEEEKAAHIERNQTLLQEELRKNPMDLRYRTQLALQLATYDNEAALEFCRETFRVCLEQRVEPGFQWQLSLMFRLFEAMGTDAATARNTYNKVKEQYGLSETAENAICFQLVRIHILSGEIAGAYPYAVRYFDLLDWLEQNPEQQQLQMTADFLRYQNKTGYLEMLHFCAYCAWQAKEYDSAWNWYQAMPWEENFGYNEEDFGFLLCLAQEKLDAGKLLHILKRILGNTSMMQNAGIRTRVAGVLQSLKRTGKSESDSLTPAWIKSDIKLTIGILVSNNMATIRKCMESLKPILQQVPSELIVVDTVGEEKTDGSLYVAKEYATKLLRFAWCNDFAAARNCFVEQANGEWLLFVDDDEWFEDAQEIIDFFHSGESERYGQGSYIIRNYLQNGSYNEVPSVRLIRRTSETRFVGRIHEQINEAFPPRKEFTCYAHHTGYVFQTKEEREKHFLRNVPLLEEELKTKGYTPHLCAQLIQELYSMEQTREKGYQFCLQCIPVLVEEKGQIAQAETQWVLAASAKYFSYCEDHDALLARVDILRKSYRLSQMAELFLSTMLVISAQKKQDFATVEKEILNYITMREWLTSHPESVATQAVLDLGCFYGIKTYCDLLYIGATCANQQKKYELANLYWKLFPWNEESVDKTPYKKEMEQTLQGLKALVE